MKSLMLAGATALMLDGVCLDWARAEAPSFDCRQAVTPMDKQICADPKLSALDSALSQAFRAALLADPAKREGLLKEQRQWVADRASLCLDKAPDFLACLTKSYQQRIAVLTAIKPPPTAHSKLCATLAEM